jgi:arylsulfatase A-like enzyme
MEILYGSYDDGLERDHGGGRGGARVREGDASQASLDAALATYAPDGQSLLGLLYDDTKTFERAMFWRMNHRGQRAMRQGDFKYLRVDGNDYVFDLTEDARERANLGKHQPERLAAMRAAWEAWNATMPPIPDDATVSLGYDRSDMPQR